MPINGLPPLELGGESHFWDYESWLLENVACGLVDPLKRRIYVPPTTCMHICYKEVVPGEGDVWSQERAECLGWLPSVLTRPDEIRPSHRLPGREVYFLTISNETVYRYLAIVQPEPKNNTAVLITAYPSDKRYWDEARRGGTPLHRVKQR